MAAWGTIWNFTLLVWTRPQWDAKRVNVRKKQRFNWKIDGTSAPDESSLLDGTRADHHANEMTIPSASSGCPGQKDRDPGRYVKQEDCTSSQDTQENGHKVNRVSSSVIKRRKTHTQLSSIASVMNDGDRIGMRPTDAASIGAEQEFEYYWQGYPDDGSFLTRLDWAFDIVSTFRMTGK